MRAHQDEELEIFANLTARGLNPLHAADAHDLIKTIDVLISDLAESRREIKKLKKIKK